MFSRSVTDSINQLITMCTQNAPGQRECDNALRELEVCVYGNKTHYCVFYYVKKLKCLCGLQAVRGLLDNPNEPVNDLSYFDCIESVMENSKVTAS